MRSNLNLCFYILIDGSEVLATLPPAAAVIVVTRVPSCLIVEREQKYSRVREKENSEKETESEKNKGKVYTNNTERSEQENTTEKLQDRETARYTRGAVVRHG